MEEDEQELLEIPREEVIAQLNEKQRRFCEVYVRNFNVILSAKQAGYSTKCAHVIGYQLRQKPHINRYICWLKIRISKRCEVTTMDIIDHYARIAFADITDFIAINGNTVALVPGDMIDGQIIKQVKQGRDGITVELYDKMQALDKLERFFDVMPKDWKQKIEERKVELLVERLQIERIKAGQIHEEIEDDGFLDALKDTATEVWDDKMEE